MMSSEIQVEPDWVRASSVLSKLNVCAPPRMCAPVMVELEGETDPLQIAMKELKWVEERVVYLYPGLGECPFLISRQVCVKTAYHTHTRLVQVYSLLNSSATQPVTKATKRALDQSILTTMKGNAPIADFSFNLFGEYNNFEELDSAEELI